MMKRSTTITRRTSKSFGTGGSCAKSANVLNTIRDALEIPRGTGEIKTNKN